MSYPVRVQLKYWGIAALVFVVVLWVLGDVLLPFVIGSTIAYTISFSEDMDDTTVSPDDFGNAGSASITVASVVETSANSGTDVCI